MSVTEAETTVTPEAPGARSDATRRVRGRQPSPRWARSGTLAGAAAALFGLASLTVPASTSASVFDSPSAAPVAPVAPADDFGVTPFRPVVTINSPTPALYTQVESRQPKVFLDGKATDPQDGPVPGSRLRWTAQSLDGQTPLTLCVGSNFPGSGKPGSLGIYKDCSEATVELPCSWPTGRWTIVLEGADKHGNVGTADVTVQVRCVVL